MRNFFVDVQKNGLEILGGQEWALFTPNRKGLSPLPSDIFSSQDMDTNYQAGLVWARQSQFRLIAHPNENVAFGVSLDNPQQYVGDGIVTFPAALSTAATGEFNNTTTTYSAPNVHPDIIFKAAYDGHAGDKILHVEAGALIRSFRFLNPVGTKPTLSWIAQYSYVWRDPWSIPSSGARYAKTNMVWLDLRYSLPVDPSGNSRRREARGRSVLSY
jgi:hypothetical protein